MGYFTSISGVTGNLPGESTLKPPANAGAMLAASLVPIPVWPWVPRPASVRSNSSSFDSQRTCAKVRRPWVGLNRLAYKVYTFRWEMVGCNPMLTLSMCDYVLLSQRKMVYFCHSNFIGMDLELQTSMSHGVRKM